MDSLEQPISDITMGVGWRRPLQHGRGRVPGVVQAPFAQPELWHDEGWVFAAASPSVPVSAAALAAGTARATAAGSAGTSVSLAAGNAALCAAPSSK